MDRDRDTGREDREEAAPETAAPLGVKLKLALNYAMMAAPALALLAFILASIALFKQPAQPATDPATTARIESLNTSLTEIKSELENLKFMQGRERTQRADERKEEDRAALIVQHVSNIERKLKITPTLEDNLSPGQAEHAATPAPTLVVPPTHESSPAPVAHPAPAVNRPASSKPATTQSAPSKPTPSKPAPVRSSSTAPEKGKAQTKPLKEVIEQFNESSAKKH